MTVCATAAAATDAMPAELEAVPARVHAVVGRTLAGARDLAEMLAQVRLTLGEGRYEVDAWENQHVARVAQSLADFVAKLTSACESARVDVRVLLAFHGGLPDLALSERGRSYLADVQARRTGLH